MGKRILTTSLTLGMLFAAGTAAALPFSSFDPRSFAMGGTGVASGTSANAVFFNPALLAAARADEDFSLELPILGGRVADPDNMIDAVDAFDQGNYVSNFDSAIIALNTTPSAATLNQLNTAANDLAAGLATLSNKAVQAEGDAAFVVGIPSKRFGISVFGNAYVVGGGLADISAADLAAISGITSSAATCVATPPCSLTAPTLTSAVEARFALLKEAGVSLAHQFSIAGGDVAIGATPKVIQATTYDYRFSGNQLDTAQIDLSTGEADESGFNLDVGVAKDFGNGFKAGLAVKNLIAQEYTTVLGNKIKVDPQARVGVMHQTEWTTVALDADLTENDPAGYESKSRYIALGAELDLFDTLQLRFGYRNNTSDTGTAESDTLSAGVGFSPFGVHVDLAVAGNADEIGGAMQLGFRF